MNAHQFITPLRPFQQALAKVALACSQDEKREVLHYLEVIITPGRARLQAADGFRLHRVDLFYPTETSGACFRALLTPSQISALLKAKIARKDDPLLTLDDARHTVSVDDKQLGGSWNIEDRFPDVEQIFPKPIKLELTVDQAELLAAVKRARVFSRDGSNVVPLHVIDPLCIGGEQKTHIIVHGMSEENGESFSVVSTSQARRFGRDNLVIGFNADFLVEFLKNATRHRAAVRT